MFSALLLARDEDGEQLTDREVRDELLTLLLAGPRDDRDRPGVDASTCCCTTARVYELRASGDDAYLDAVVKEALRHAPGDRRASGAWCASSRSPLNGYEVPAGIEINPSIRTIHRRADLYPSPSTFTPERFLGADAPDTYTWVPFGGGTRRCLGASFAQTRDADRARAGTRARRSCAAVDPRPAKVQFRAITLAPKGGVRVIQDQPPLPPRSDV